MSKTKASILLCLLPFLFSCATKQRVVEAAVPPTEVVRPPCLPGDELMAPPKALTPLSEMSMRQAFAQWIDDMRAYQDLRLQTERLQEFVRTQCR